MYETHGWVVTCATHIDLLPGRRLELRLLANGEGVGEDLCPRGDSHLEVVSSLFNLRDALDVFALLDKLIRETYMFAAARESYTCFLVLQKVKWDMNTELLLLK